MAAASAAATGAGFSGTAISAQSVGNLTSLRRGGGPSQLSVRKSFSSRGWPSNVIPNISKVSRFLVLKRRCVVDDLEPCLPVIVDTGDAVSMVEPQLVPEEQSNLNYFLR